ncbi:MAG: translation initiation factor IF-2 [Candidatus Omnitrophica bacterium]|nr:translation initiation factor IF-2 [Candidatus Omnitrophota bacterium]
MVKTKKESKKKEKTPTVKKAAVKAAKLKPAPKAAAKPKAKPAAREKSPAPVKLKPAPKKEKAAVAPVAEEKPKAVAVALKPEVVAPKPEVKVTEKPAAPKAAEVKVAPKIVPPKPPAPKAEAPKAAEPAVLPKPAEIKPVELKEIELELPVNVKDLSIKLQEKPSLIIKSLMDLGIMVGINQPLDESTVNKLSQKYRFKIKQAPTREEAALEMHQAPDNPKDLKPRAPIVTIMGHVDHGKTSLLDAIRKTKVAEAEFGGITQHIGAYRVRLAHGEITFLDTPGHEAFTAMRSRGASVTDVVVLVVAADDGIMPQTIEAIDHAKAAGVPIVVAINKMDKPGASPDRVKKQLAEYGLNPEDWGGKTITVGVSAKTGQGIDNLLEMMLLEAQMLELKANPNREAKGVVIEAKMAKGKGPVATLLVQNGTLRLNENIIVGSLYGKIRAMFDDRGHSVTAATPGVPVEVLGISGVPEAGEPFFVVSDEKQARALAASREEGLRQQQIKAIKKISLEDLHAQIEEGKIKELKLIIKADVQGSLEAIKDTLDKLPVSEIKIEIIHSGIGNINSSDVILASASNALILGFNVVIDEPAKLLVEKEGVEIKSYNIIYELANEIRAAIEGMLEPKLKKVFLGRAEVRKVFKLSRAGTVAGCFVSKGKFNRTANVSVVRNGQEVFEGKLSSLKRFKDDVREVQEGFECGMAVAGFDQLAEGDVIEAYEIEKIARKL